MTDRKLSVKPKRRLDVSGFDAPAGSAAPEPPPPAAPAPSAAKSRRRQSGKPRSSTRRAPRRRVHATVTRGVAAALRSRTEESGETNTKILIDAFTGVGGQVRSETADDTPFAPRRAPEGREGVYFYLAPAEIDHLEDWAKQAGFESRSGYISELLAAYLSG